MPDPRKDAPVTRGPRDIALIVGGDLGLAVASGLGLDEAADTIAFYQAHAVRAAERDVRAAIIERLRVIVARDQLDRFDLHLLIAELEAENG